MPLVSASLAEWLGSESLVEVVEKAAALAAWGNSATESEASSPLASRAEAAAEAQRQIDFLGFPLVIETIEVPGLQASLLGEVRRIDADFGGYQSAPDVFVIGVEERENGVTLLTVLRKMGVN